MNKFTKMFALIFAISLIVAGCTNNENAVKRHSESRIMMDTLITIHVYADKELAQKALSKAFSVFQKIEDIASFHLEDSELTALNENNKHEASELFYELIQHSLKLYEETYGFFDVSFAILHKAYGFYDNNPRLPNDESLKQLLAYTRLPKVLTAQNYKLSLNEGSLIDLGGIAGGFAVDKAAEVLREMDCEAFLIDDAGDIFFEGIKPDNSPWRIAVRDPRDNGALAIIESTSPIAISTSGDYERYIKVDGKKYGHIFNPITGKSVDYYSSVTIIASTTVDADAYSTAVFAMPPEKAYKYVEEKKLPALFLTKDDEIHVSTKGKKWFNNVKEQ